MVVSFTVPGSVNLSQYTDVQRGTVFLFFLTIFTIFVSTVIKIVTNKLDPVDGKEYEDKGQKKMAQSSEAFDREIIQSQIIVEEDSGTVQYLKKISEFNTNHNPIFILFALNLITGVTYAFDMCLYFFAMTFLVCFTMLKLHRKCMEHKVFLVILENMWIVLSFFWVVNIWATGRWVQPYFKVA